MVNVGRGVAGKLTEAGNLMYEHGPAAAGDLRQHGEQPALELHHGRRSGAPAPVLELQRLSRATSY